jgi:hypothetical protein
MEAMPPSSGRTVASPTASTGAGDSRHSEHRALRPKEPTPPVTHVRGTLLVASREQMSAVGAYEQYVAALADTTRDQLVGLIAASWVPIELALEHFNAIDRLALPLDVVERATGAVAAKLQGTLLRTVAKTVQASGASPLSIVRTVGMLWGRTFKGGSMEVRPTGPKDGVIRLLGSPLLASRYHRTGVRVHVQVAADLFSERAVVREQSYKPAAQELTLRVQWV